MKLLNLKILCKHYFPSWRILKLCELLLRKKFHLGAPPYENQFNIINQKKQKREWIGIKDKVKAFKLLVEVWNYVFWSFRLYLILFVTKYINFPMYFQL